MAGLERLLEGLDPDERRRGKQFEQIVEWFLTHAPEYRSQLRRVWLWDEWPDRPSRDLGVDLVAEDSTGGLWAIQAKAYSPDSSVTKRDIDSFLSASATRLFSYRLLVATTDRIAHNARLTIEHQAIQVGILLRSDLAAMRLNWPESPTRLSAPKPPRKTLRPDQRDAVRDVLAGFENADRGQMIRACGTGKTLIALGLHEQLDSRRTLVLVPSLSLLDQTLREWSSNAKQPFEFLAVCSDETVTDHDAPVGWTHDLGLPVTTDPAVIAAFLRRRGDRVVFCTYQSSPQIAAVYRHQPRTPGFDLAVCDEAHRCAGPVSSDFATILHTKQVRVARRLFMTATPRYFTGRLVREAKAADFEIASMDNEATFGPVLHRLSFAEAIERDLLSDYQVAIIGVDDATYKDWAEHGKFVTPDGMKITDARTLAGQIGLAKAMRRFDLRRMISFHSRIAAARRFSTELPDVIAWMPSRQRPTGAIVAAHVSGEMATSERSRRLNFLKEPATGSRALVSNARCLAEGVDVPALDGVAFIDPRRSEVDIVQAVGRAIRKADDKKLGTIVLPVFVRSSDDADEVLATSAFQPVWDVLRALRAHDEALAEELDILRRELGHHPGSIGRLPTKIRVDLPIGVSKDFASAFDTRIVEQTTARWEFWYGLLEAFVAREGHPRVPVDHVEDGYRLGQWVRAQRAASTGSTLAQERVRRLEALPGWTWDPFADKWEDSFASLEAFVAREGHARVPNGHLEDNYRLGDWVNNQRAFFRRAALTEDRVRRLEGLPRWTWELRSDWWEEGFASLQVFVAREGHARVPRRHLEQGFRLGQWVDGQRTNHARSKLTDDRSRRLEALPAWTWDPHVDRWEEGFASLQAFAAREGHTRVPKDHLEQGFRLGQWVAVQRSTNAASKLSEDRARRLKALRGWSWDARSDRWEEGFALLQAFVAREGHARVPQAHIEDQYWLGRWTNRQRYLNKTSKLARDRARRLEALPGWSWDVRTIRTGR
jgi:superfamily II DNA or RNA helicase